MEENKSSLSLSIFFLALFLSSSLFTFVAIFFDISPVIVPAGVMLVASSILLSRPLALLALLIIARMSLDIFGNTYSIVLGDSFSLSLSQAIGIEVAVLGTVALFLFRRNLPKLPLITPLFSILLWGFLSLLVSIDTSMTAREILRVFDLLILFALAFVAVRTRSDFRKLLILFFASSIIPIAAGIYQFAFDIGFQDESVNIPRIFGTFSHPNIFSPLSFLTDSALPSFLHGFLSKLSGKIPFGIIGDILHRHTLYHVHAHRVGITFSISPYSRTTSLSKTSSATHGYSPYSLSCGSPVSRANSRFISPIARQLHHLATYSLARRHQCNADTRKRPLWKRDEHVLNRF
jgi:hypothetical protein